MDKQTRESVLWHALAKIGAKQARRELLRPQQTPLELNVEGHVGGEAVAAMLSGHLLVGPDTERTSTKSPPFEHVIGLLLERLGPRKRHQVVEDLVTDYARRDQTLPDCSAASVELGKRLMQQLRVQVVQSAKGAVSCSYVVG